MALGATWIAWRICAAKADRLRRPLPDKPSSKAWLRYKVPTLSRPQKRKKQIPKKHCSTEKLIPKAKHKSNERERFSLWTRLTAVGCLHWSPTELIVSERLQTTCCFDCQPFSKASLKHPLLQLVPLSTFLKLSQAFLTYHSWSASSCFSF